LLCTIYIIIIYFVRIYCGRFLYMRICPTILYTQHLIFCVARDRVQIPVRNFTVPRSRRRLNACVYIYIYILYTYYYMSDHWSLSMPHRVNARCTRCSADRPAPINHRVNDSRVKTVAAAATTVKVLLRIIIKITRLTVYLYIYIGHTNARARARVCVCVILNGGHCAKRQKIKPYSEYIYMG